MTSHFPSRAVLARIGLTFFLAWIILCPTAPLRAENRGLLWQVTDSRGHELYLMGSFHVGNAGIYPLNEAISQAFARSTRLAVEIDINSLSDADSGFMLKNAYNPPDLTLDAQLSPRTRALLPKAFKFIPQAVIQRMRPWFASMLLEIQSLAASGYSEVFGLDLYFLTQARARQIPILELESFQEQMTFFVNLSPDENDLFLWGTLEELDREQAVFDQFLAAWKEGDAEKFYTAATESLRKYPELKPINDRLIIQRNWNMAARIAPWFLERGQVTFVVVGAAHLVGPDGLPSLMARAGLTVTQL
ncbi:MAG: TraB/GumN family protein [Deltaproteobacteria bacterium]|jgi:uncharacterized protein YbaP (TraB family)|nr:TraB/GumN family protein [Deltaproteobacteria bacterium]